MVMKAGETTRIVGSAASSANVLVSAATTAMRSNSRKQDQKTQPTMQQYSTFPSNCDTRCVGSRQNEAKDCNKNLAKHGPSLWSYFSHRVISPPQSMSSYSQHSRPQHLSYQRSSNSPRVDQRSNDSSTSSHSLRIVSKHHHSRRSNKSSDFRTFVQRMVMHWPWRFFLSMLLCVAISMFYHRAQKRRHKSQQYTHSQVFTPPLTYDAQPEWQWDHNVYNPSRRSKTTTYTAATSSPPLHDSTSSPPLISAIEGAQERNLLVAQVAGNSALANLAEVSSRPNRAYARQWGRDYVLYKAFAPSIERVCFDKVAVLRAILEGQRQLHVEFWSSLGVGSFVDDDDISNDTDQTRQGRQSRAVQYDVVALLSPEAIIADLDRDLLSLLPQDKLLATARWQDPSASSSYSDWPMPFSSSVVLFNLRHKFASRVVRLWYSMTEPPISCGAGNDLLILLHAVRRVLEEEEYNGRNNHHHSNKDDDFMLSESMVQAMSSIIASLDETNDGFVGGYSIKTIPFNVPTSKAAMLLANEAETRAELQKIADSVCYRYYPKCEVL